MHPTEDTLDQLTAHDWTLIDATLPTTNSAVTLHTPSDLLRLPGNPHVAYLQRTVVNDALLSVQPSELLGLLCRANVSGLDLLTTRPAALDVREQDAESQALARDFGRTVGAQLLVVTHTQLLQLHLSDPVLQAYHATAAARQIRVDDRTTTATLHSPTEQDELHPHAVHEQNLYRLVTHPEFIHLASRHQAPRHALLDFARRLAPDALQALGATQTVAVLQGVRSDLRNFLRQHH